MFKNYIAILTELREWETNWKKAFFDKDISRMLSLLNLHGYIIDTRENFYWKLDGMFLNEEITLNEVRYYMRESRRPYKLR
jgi:hypothetical protein